MHLRTSPFRWTATLVVVLTALAAPTPAGAFDVSTLDIQLRPLVGAKLVAERVAARDAATSARWRLNADLYIKNNGTSSRRLTRLEIAYPNTPIFNASTTYSPTAPATLVAPGKTIKVMVPEQSDRAFPLPPQIRIRLDFGSTAVAVTKGLAEHVSPVAQGAYRFPSARADLPGGRYWTDGQNHVWGSNHRKSGTQRFALDLVVRRWNGEQWTSRKAGTDGDDNEDSLVWGMPVRAIADGWILRCGRKRDDNVKGESTSGAGNFMRIVHAPGEVALYAHMRAGSVPATLCPKDGVDASESSAIRVRAGDKIGEVGNSGHSGGPHLHLHIDTTGATGSGQGLPLHFRGLRTRYAGEDWDRSEPCDLGNRNFAVARAAAVDRRQLIEPLWPSNLRELARWHVREPCLQDIVAGWDAAGYSPTWFDGYDVEGRSYVNVVFHPGNGDYVMRNGLSASAYQSSVSSWFDQGYRPTLVEAYRNGNARRFAFVARRVPGPPPAAYHNRTAAQHANLARDLEDRGYAPAAIAVVSLSGALRYTALWQPARPPVWRASWQIRSDRYQRWVEDRLAAGQRLSYVNAYNHDGRIWFSAIADPAATTASARHNRTLDGLQSLWLSLLGDGLRTSVLTGYRDGDSPRFAGLWRQAAASR